MSEELKPCPFCGSKNLSYEPKMIFCHCNDCGSESGGSGSIETGGYADNWNSRPLEDTLRAEIEHLKTLLQEWLDYTDGGVGHPGLLINQTMGALR